MKKLLLFLITLPLLIACDHIGEDDRYIETGGVQAQRRVLLEEFTGQRCVNCPAAHAVIEKLEEQYGEDLIVVSIHAGNFGIKAPAGLMQPEGDEYAAKWGVSAYPCGVVDMKGGVLNTDAWASAIRNDLSKETPLDLELEAKINGNDIDITTSLLSSEKISGNLLLWVVESGIVAYQIDGDSYHLDYVHNNVFRACVNGLWGQSVEIVSNTTQEISNSITINEAWNLENISIVGYVYNDSGVIQVNKCKLI